MVLTYCGFGGKPLGHVGGSLELPRGMWEVHWSFPSDMWEVHWSFPGVWYWPTAGLVLTYCGFGGKPLGHAGASLELRGLVLTYCGFGGGMRELPRGLVLTHCGFGG